ncbi:MAG: hypothetical protein WDM85_15370 [Caulobacteraceae bacterium]
MFSDRAVVTTYQGKPTLMFRAANRRRNRIVEAEVTVNLARDGVTQEGARMRGFENLTTVRSRSPVFILTWQIMHQIDESSPLFGETTESLQQQRAEIVVILKGLDETFAQTIHAPRVLHARGDRLGRPAGRYLQPQRRRAACDRLHALPRYRRAIAPVLIAGPACAG